MLRDNISLYKRLYWCPSVSFTIPQCFLNLVVWHARLESNEQTREKNYGGIKLESNEETKDKIYGEAKLESNEETREKITEKQS